MFCGGKPKAAAAPQNTGMNLEAKHSMSKAKIYNLSGEVVGEQELNPEIFGVEVKPVVVQQVAVAQAANARRPWAHAKTRSNVRGGGKKPWKQKGTGRARAGSIRSPIWRGGGVTFGPLSKDNYGKRVNKKAKQIALRMVLSDKAANERVILVDSLEMPEVKTKAMAAAVGKLPIKGRKSLLVLNKGLRNTVLSARNMKNVNTLGANSLNVISLLDGGTIVIAVDALHTIDKLYAPKK